MRLLSVTLRHYRIHGECTVTFDERCTLIGGPNESGKSTLVEAIHHALFLRAKTTGTGHERLLSLTHPGKPEVHLRFACGARIYTLIKRFAGAAGTTRLTEEGGATWTDDAAETQLAGLLGVEPARAGKGGVNQAREQWGHLWVWQGTAGNDPAAHATEQAAALFARLQAQGGAAVLQSTLDSRVAEHFDATYRAACLEGGKPRAGSDLARATDSTREAEAAWIAAQERCTALAAAMEKVRGAEATLRSLQESLPGCQSELAAVRLKLGRVQTLRGEEQARAAEAKAAQDAWEQIAAGDQAIAIKRADITQARHELAPAADRTLALTTDRDAAAVAATTAHHAVTAAQTADSAARVVRDCLDAHVRHGEAALAFKTLEKRQARVIHAFQQRAAIDSSLAALPALRPKDLTQLRHLSREVGEADATVRAMATGIEVTAADPPVLLNGEAIPVGNTRVILDTAELSIGAGVRLAIRPGGGASVLEARHHLDQARNTLASELARLAVSSLAEAEQVAARRAELDKERAPIDATLRELDADAVEADLAQASAALQNAAGRLSQRRALAPDVPEPDSLETARTRLEEADRQCELASTTLVEQSALGTAARDALARAEERLQQHLSALQEVKDRLTTLQVQLDQLLVTHGDDATRAGLLSQRQSVLTSARQSLDTVRKELEQLDPGRLEADETRLAQAVSRLTDARTHAAQERAVALAQLNTEGTRDPQADLEQAAARRESAQAHLQHLTQRHQAVSRLRDYFNAEREVLTQKFTQPLADLVGIYLSRLFGPGASVTVTLDNHEFGSFQVVRRGGGAGALEFDRLSVGAREQVATAIRLAMAEVLAEGHDGCLPVVLDDAFAYSDPERVKQLHSMLYAATQRGLQLIVLSCTPADYAGLGAATIRLTSPELGVFLPPDTDAEPV